MRAVSVMGMAGYAAGSEMHGGGRDDERVN